MAYNRYHGNSGRRERVEEGPPTLPRPEPPSPPPPVPEREPEPPRSGPPPPRDTRRPPPERHPPSAFPLDGELGRLLERLLSPERMETEDVLLLLILYLLYRESGDRDFLIMIGGLLFF